MLPLKPRRRSEVVGRWCGLVEGLPIVTFIAHCGLPPQYSHPCQTPWSVFQDGVKSTISSAPAPARARARFPPADADAEQAGGTGRAARERPENIPPASTDDLWFPLSNFRSFLTLFSKFFSSFLHSTCSLSVSHPYLALDGIYHPL